MAYRGQFLCEHRFQARATIVSNVIEFMCCLLSNVAYFFLICFPPTRSRVHYTETKKTIRAEKEDYFGSHRHINPGPVCPVYTTGPRIRGEQINPKT